MEQAHSKVSFSISEGKIEIAGSEEFVNKLIEAYAEPISRIVSIISESSVNNLGSGNKHKQHSSTPIAGKGIAEYPDIFIVDGEALVISADIPGSSMAQKALNTALIYSFGRKLLGFDETTVEELKQQFSTHGCLDKPNFATHIKSGDPKLYIYKEANGNRTIKLTRPGEKKAEELLIEISQSVTK